MPTPIEIASTGRFSYYFDWDPEITQEKAKDVARSLAERCVDVVILNHHHLRWTYVDLFAEIERVTRVLVDACHQQGLLVVEHHSSTCAAGDNAYKGRRIKDWANISVRTGKPGFLPFSHAGEIFDSWWCCINNPEWQESYYDYIGNFFARTGVDGLQHDDIHFVPGWMYCGCEHCREKFESIFHYELPSGDAHRVWENFDSQIWRDWLMFRRISAGDEFERISKVLGPDKILFGCCSVGLNTTLGAHDAGYTYEDFARGANLLYQEDIYHPRNEPTASHHFYHYKRHFLDRKFYQSLSDVTDKPCVVYNYPSSEDADFFCWSLAKSFAHSYIRISGAWSGDVSHLRWERDNAELFTNTGQIANIGLLHSSSTMTYAGADSQYYLDELRGWAEVMTDENIPFRIVLADTDFSRDQLHDLELVILPNVKCLSDGQVEILRGYVKDGGNLILTFESSLCDQMGSKRNNFGLREVLGFDYLRRVEGINLPIYPMLHRTENAVMRDVPSRVPYCGPHAICSAPADIGAIAAWIEKYNLFATDSPAPAIIEGRYGKGRFVYLSFKPGVMCATQGTCPPVGKDYNQRFVQQTGSAAAPMWVDERIPAHRTIILNTITSLTSQERWPYALKSSPQGLLANAYASGDSIVVSLVNAKGARMEHGAQIPAKAEVNYPELSEDIEIRLSSCRIANAFLASPDVDGRIEVKWDHDPDGTTLRVPASLVKRFALIVAENRRV